ncbi:MAG: phage portal protein [Dehalococcoidia bacterium]|nr:phage portal protein [Dehalococcoidia bacterium]
MPEQVALMDADRLRRYADHLAFYNGDQWPPSNRRNDRRLVFNYAKAIVDKTTSYLMTGQSSVVDAVDETPEAATRARASERALAEVAEANQLDQLDFDTELDAAILGDGVYKVTWDETERRVRVTAPDVQGLFAWWTGDDVSRVWRVCSRYALDAESAQMLYGIAPRDAGRARALPVAGAAPPLANGMGRASAVEIVESWTADRFELWADGARIDERANGYGFIPFVIYPNIREPKKFWGTSDLPAIREPVRELNRALSQLSMILELSGNPIAVLENVTESRDIAVMPGAVWELPERAKAYLLDLLQGGGVKLHADYVDVVYRTLHDLGESPRTAFGDNPTGLSGVALNVELDPLLKKVARKRLIRSAAYRKRNEMILRLLDRYAPLAAQAGAGYAPYRSRVVWGTVLPADRSRLVEDERVLVASGIHSRRRAANELGVDDPEAEWARWLAEQAALAAPTQA